MNFHSKEWPFNQPKECAVITLKSIVANSSPILLVTHDLDDHGWQFLNNEDFSVDDALVVSLESITQIDPSVFEIATIQPGYSALRDSPDDNWKISPISA